MTGVEILAMEEVLVKSDFNLQAFWIAFGIAVASFICLGFIGIINYCDWSEFAAMELFGILVSVLLGVLFGSIEATPIEYETQYKVIISDEVSMNDFLSEYEIIDQEGKIYTVRERNDE